MVKIYRVNVALYEDAYVTHALRHTPKAYSEDDITYLADFRDAWEDTAKDGYIEIDEVGRLVCDRFTPEEAKYMEEMLVSGAKVVELSPDQKVPTYKKPYRKTEYVTKYFEENGVKIPCTYGVVKTTEDE